MNVYELTRDQLIELKQHMLCECRDDVSYGELCEADDLISDAEVFKEYEGTSFTTDDFFCQASTEADAA